MQYFRGRVSNFNQSEAGKDLPRQYRTQYLTHTSNIAEPPDPPSRKDLVLAERNPDLLVFTVPELAPGLNYKVRIAKKESETGMTFDIEREVHIETGKISIAGETETVRYLQS